MKTIILGAGMGSRLGAKPVPKPLTQLASGCTILQSQVKNLKRYVDVNEIIVVVGFKKELIMEAHSDLTFVYNDFFDTTNTSQSLLKALRKVKGEDVLWLNGDVVFDHKILPLILKSNDSCMAVNTDKCADEEVKYKTNGDGSITEVSKAVVGGLGEAVGINIVKAEDLEMFKTCLAMCGNNDYFEKGLELAISRGMKVYPVDISGMDCVEVDFCEDLAKANSFIEEKKAKG